MSTFTLPLLRAPFETPLALTGIILARRLRRRMRAWSDRRRLQALPDYLLADIGVARREIATATEYGRVDSARGAAEFSRSATRC